MGEAIEALEAVVHYSCSIRKTPSLKTCIAALWCSPAPHWINSTKKNSGVTASVFATLKVTAKVWLDFQASPVKVVVVNEKKPCCVITFPVVEPVSIKLAICDSPPTVAAELFDGQHATPFRLIP